MEDIRIIELELFNYCNRTCKWCPNKFTKSRSERFIRMNLSVLESLISDLKKINYDKVISFSRYNEPFFNLEEIIYTFAYIKKELPNSRLVANTNGDFIGIKEIRKLSEFFSEITIMDYDSDNELLSRYGDYFRINECEVLIKTFDMEINDRGGSLKEFSGEERTEPCLEPKHFLAIDYTGDVMPCCNMRHDLHEDFIIGNINKDSIFKILKSKKRIELMNEIPFIKPCKYCIKKPGRHTRPTPGIKF